MTRVADLHMKHPPAQQQQPHPSPLQSLLVNGADDLAQDEDLAQHPRELRTLATQIKHNLEHQHGWTDITVHTHSPLTDTTLPLPRPLLSGLPPQRLYVHPDEQIELLKRADRERKAKQEGQDGVGALEVKAEPEREWVLPTRLSEKWTLRRLAEVFDGVTLVPPPPPPSPPSAAVAGEGGVGEDGGEARVEEGKANPWRTTKRVVLATVDTDSTVVYYIVHDGVVKPRQN